MTTFRRPEGAMSALSGIAGQVFPRTGASSPSSSWWTTTRPRPSRTGRGLAAGLPLPARRCLQTRQGVASARNRCLDLVTRRCGLHGLHRRRRDSRAAMARRTGTGRRAGRTPKSCRVPCCRASTRERLTGLRAGRFLDLGPFPEGETLAWGYSGNGADLGAAIAPPEPALRRAVDRSGGEDQHFHQGTPRWLRHPHGSGCDRA